MSIFSRRKLPKPRKSLFNSTFFKFLGAFALILVLSFVAILVTTVYEDELNQVGSSECPKGETGC